MMSQSHTFNHMLFPPGVMHSFYVRSEFRFLLHMILELEELLCHVI